MEALFRSIYYEMLERLTIVQDKKKTKANEELVGLDLIEELGFIDNKTTFSQEKARDILKFSQDIDKSEQFIELKIYVEDLDIDENDKVQTIITSSCVLDSLETRGLSTQELFLLSYVMSPVPKEDYMSHGVVLSNSEVLNRFLNKTTDLEEQVILSEEIFDYCDEFAYENMSKEVYETIVNNVLNIIDSYQIQSFTK